MEAELNARIAMLEGENQRIKSEQTQRDAAAYNRGYTERRDQEVIKDLELKDHMWKGMESIKNELRMQGCASHIRTFAGENSEKYLCWAHDMEKNLTQLGNDDAIARALVLQTLTGPAADFATREIRNDSDITWLELRRKLDSRYNDMADSAFARQKLRRMGQSRSESVQNYFERLMKHARHAYGDSQLKDPLVQQQLVEIFLEGLGDDNMVRRLIRLKPTTLEAALRHATSEQQAKKAFDLRRGNLPEEEDMEIGVISREETDRPVTQHLQRIESLITNHICKPTGNSSMNEIAPPQQYIPEEFRPTQYHTYPKND